MNYDKKTLQQSGIYAIVNKATGRRYIGQTGRFMYRWTKHRLQLRRNEHPNRALQQDWNTYTADAFEFLILEVAGQLALKERETWHLNQCDDLYNTNYKRYTPDPTPEQ